MQNIVYINRDLQHRVYQSFERPYVTAVLGPRRVGKSTLMAHYINLHADRCWVTLNMDAMVERQRSAAGELQALIQEKALRLIGTDTTIWVGIDEAQKCPELFDQIKILYDQYKNQPHGIKFILTGSGSLSLHQLSAETLAGRIEILYLREFSLHEIARLKLNVDIPKTSILDLAINNPEALQSEIAKLSPFKPVLEQALHHVLIWGGLPEMAFSHHPDELMSYLENYLQTYLEKDVRAVQEITQLNVYQQLMEIVASQTGSIREDKKILESLGCSRETLKKYRGYLIATLMYQEIYPFIGSSLKRLTKSPKGFLVNNGLISFLTGVNQMEILERTGLIGHRFENWFLQAMNTWLDRAVSQHRVYYWRTSAGIEVDFIVDKKPNIYPFEVTFSHQKNDRKVRHLKQFMADEKHANLGFYIYNGAYEYDQEAGILYLPAWCLC